MYLDKTIHKLEAIRLRPGQDLLLPTGAAGRVVEITKNSVRVRTFDTTESKPLTFTRRAFIAMLPRCVWRDDGGDAA